MNKKINWDAIGVSATIACAIHCALLPLFLTSLPLFGTNIIHNAYFEGGMVALAFLIGTISFTHGFRRHHHSLKPLLVFSIGFIFLVSRLIWHEYQLLFLIPAVVLIVAAHIINYQYCQSAGHCHADDCKH